MDSRMAHRKQTTHETIRYLLSFYHNTTYLPGYSNPLCMECLQNVVSMLYEVSFVILVLLRERNSATS